MDSNFKYEFRMKKSRSGSVEYKYMCPLMRGEHRPTILVDSPKQAAANGQGIGRYGHIFATGISGYTRQFHDLDEAMKYAADVPLAVGGFIRAYPFVKAEEFQELRARIARECEGSASIVHCEACGQVVAIIFKDFTCENGDGWCGTEDEHKTDDDGVNGGILCEDCNK